MQPTVWAGIIWSSSLLPCGTLGLGNWHKNADTLAIAITLSNKLSFTADPWNSSRLPCQRASRVKSQTFQSFYNWHFQVKLNLFSITFLLCFFPYQESWFSESIRIKIFHNYSSVFILRYTPNSLRILILVLLIQLLQTLKLFCICSCHLPPIFQMIVLYLHCQIIQSLCDKFILLSPQLVPVLHLTEYFMLTPTPYFAVSHFSCLKLVSSRFHKKGPWEEYFLNSCIMITICSLHIYKSVLLIIKSLTQLSFFLSVNSISLWHKVLLLKSLKEI